MIIVAIVRRQFARITSEYLFRPSQSLEDGQILSACSFQRPQLAPMHRHNPSISISTILATKTLLAQLRPHSLTDLVFTSHAIHPHTTPIAHSFYKPPTPTSRGDTIPIPIRLTIARYLAKYRHGWRRIKERDCSERGRMGLKSQLMEYM